MTECVYSRKFGVNLIKLNLAVMIIITPFNPTAGRILAEKETLENVYKNLLEEHRVLQTSHDDTTAEKEDAVARLRDLRREARRQEKRPGGRFNESRD